MSVTDKEGPSLCQGEGVTTFAPGRCVGLPEKSIVLYALKSMTHRAVQPTAAVAELLNTGAHARSVGCLSDTGRSRTAIAEPRNAGANEICLIFDRCWSG